MAILQFFGGLLGLGVLVLVHESGHFIAARLLKVDIDTFSIGWGRPIWQKTGKNGIRFQIGMIPFGGYLQMKGEYQFKKAISEGLRNFPYEKGAFFSAHPFSRILIALAGPVINLLFAVFLFSLIAGIGYEYRSYDPRIIVTSEATPAWESGLRDGDAIAALDGKTIESYADVQQIVVENALRTISIEYTRDGRTIASEITPNLDSSRGIGVIGVYPAVEPVVDSLTDESIDTGLRPLDRILSIDSTPTPYILDVYRAVEAGGSTAVVLRDGLETVVPLFPLYREDMTPYLPVAFASREFRTPDYSFFRAIGAGFSEVGHTLAVTVRNLSLLVTELDPSQAVSGPLRISVMVGEAAASGFAQGFGTGLRLIAQFLAAISIALAFGNLLPIPVLDGGQVLMYTAELVSGKRFGPKMVALFQTAGAVIVVLLLFWALFSDVLFILNR